MRDPDCRRGSGRSRSRRGCRNYIERTACSDTRCVPQDPLVIASSTLGGDSGSSVMRTPDRVADRVADGGQRRDDGRLAAAPDAVGVVRIGHLDNLRVDHRQVGRHGYAVVEKPGIVQHAVVVVDVLLVQRPADPLDRASLHLTLDVVGVDRGAGILDGGEARHRGATRLAIKVDVRQVDREGGSGTLGGERCPTGDRPPRCGRPCAPVRPTTEAPPRR